MGEEFVILCCENIRPEVDAVLAAGTMPKATARSFPFHCGHVRSVWDTVKEQYADLERAGAEICLCGCGCGNRFDIPREVRNQPSLALVESGASLFIPETLAGYYQRSGTYLILPGWLSRWKQNTESDGLDPSTAREMFRESIKEILLLDTGVHPGIGPVLGDFAAFCGLPARTIPVGLEHLSARLTGVYLGWECEQDLQEHKATIRTAEKRVAEYSMIADLTDRIIGIHDEKTVISQVLDLITLLCSPQRAGFLPFRDGAAGEASSIPSRAYASITMFQRAVSQSQPYLITETGDGFLFRVDYDGNLVGILSVDRVSLPDSLDEYLNLTRFICRIAGLSLMIARTHQDLVQMVAERDTEIAERKQAESALQESEKRYRTIIETIQDVFFRIDREELIVMVSPSATQTFGYTFVSEMLGKPVLSLWKHPEERARFLERQKAQGGAVQDWEAEFVKSDGTAFWVSITAHLLTDGQGRYAGAEGIIRDISGRKKMEDALKNALNKLNMLSSITRHDILNQVTGLRTFLELSREDLKGTRFAEFVEKEDQAAEAIQRQIEFTRYYQDIGVNAPKWQDAGAIIHEAAAQLSLSEIDLQIAVSGVEIFADPLIVKVFFNLIENSLRHGIRVTTMTFSTEGSDAGLVITYRDNGVGVSAEDKKKLFQKGFGKHTGLGLFLSREILAITGITIVENGEPGTGVRFEMTVPNGAYRFTS
jgi:PAS domain S-box-containing protein